MSTYVLVPGAGGDAWHWHLVVERLAALGHEAIAVELPAGDPEAGLQAYADTITAAAGTRERVILVAQSMGAFSAPMARLDLERIVLVAPMIPKPGETPGQWWSATGLTALDLPFDEVETFFHDVPEDVRRAAFAQPEPQQESRPFEDAWPLEAWPAGVPIKVVAGRHDRLFPLPFMERVAHERLGADVPIEIVDSGHMPALATPDALVRSLL
jgi:pimeloyl-ACP methyl ester carboxylesterase